MLRQAAFVDANKMLKGGLHCHTTRSDGRCPPEEVINLHEQHGYDFLALTDHRIYNYANYVADSNLLIIPGTEIDCGITGPNGLCFHSVWLGHEKAENPYEQDQLFAPDAVADQYDFQHLLDEAHRNNQLTIYCHPQWSKTFVRDFENMNGNFAIEVRNTGSVIAYGVDYNNGFLWDELLRQGKRIWGVAADDGHFAHDHCRAWVRVNAQKNISDILRALENGAFYASTGPEIYDFYIDDDRVAHIKCSPCKHIKFFCSIVTGLNRKKDGSLITEASLHCPMDSGLHYLRAEVTDENGNIAWTNPIFWK